MNLLSAAIAGPVSNLITPVAVCGFGPPSRLTAQANFIYGAGGTNVTAFLQTSFDAGVTWSDIVNFQFTTSSLRKLANLSGNTPQTAFITLTDKALSANSAADGMLGDRFRAVLSSTGTYTGLTSLAIDLAWTFPSH